MSRILVAIQTTKKEKVSVLDDVDFQLDLLHSDRINVGYIINLLQMALDSGDEAKRKKYEAQIYDLIGNEVTLHDKQELIQKFIEDSTVAIIAIPNFACPICEKDHVNAEHSEHPDLIPLDMLRHFFMVKDLRVNIPMVR